MSQYSFDVRAGVKCLVGWDSHLESFFGQVFRVDSDGEQIEVDETGPGHILWVGASAPQIRTVDQLQSLLRSEALIPKEIFEKLYETEVD